MSKTIELNIPRTAAERIGAQEWKCAGCGRPTPGRARSCECPTNVVSRSDGATAWKREANAVEISEHCHSLISRLYETPAAKLKAKDVDLIKAALKRYAELHA